MNSHWVIWVDTAHREKADKLLNRVTVRMERQASNVSVERYPKTGGYRVAFEIGLEGESWNDCLVETLFLAQCVASDWLLVGDVLEDASGVSQKARDSGVSMIEWQLWRTDRDTQHRPAAELPLRGGRLKGNSGPAPSID